MPPPVRGPADRARRLLQRAAAFLMTIALLVPVIAKAGDDMVAVLDFEDFTRLDGRKLSLAPMDTRRCGTTSTSPSFTAG